MRTPSETYWLSKNNPSEFNKNKEHHESVIATDVYYSYFYAERVLKGRFEKGDKVIAASGFCILYTKNILKCRFESCEYIIANNNRFFKGYLNCIDNKIPIYYKFI